MCVLLLSIGVVCYNNLLNLWPTFNGALYIPLNVTLAAVVVGVGMGPVGLSVDEMGLKVGLVGILLGICMGILLTAPLFALATNRRAAGWIADRRVAGLSRRTLVYHTCLRIPLGTAFVEEVLFRGVLLAGLQTSEFPHPILASAVLFGLWHIAPTCNLVAANRPTAQSRVYVIAAVVSVLAMTGAGLGFAWLRLETGSLSAPIALHATVNSLATLAAFKARSFQTHLHQV
jgi:uncharacterized protein